MLVWRQQCGKEPACAVELVLYNSWDKRKAHCIYLRVG